MFAANLQPSWPRTKGTLLFYFLKLYNFGFYEIFVGSTSSELQHPWISKIRCKPKKIAKKKTFFRLNFEVLVINRSFWNFLNFKLWIHKNFVCPHHRHEKWAYFYVMEAKNGHFSVFSSSWKIDWSKFFSRSHQNFFYDIWLKPMKISSKSI